MNLARKLATGAILATVGVLAATTPADAKVVNSSCNLSSVVRVYYGDQDDSHSYCYVWDGDRSSAEGWMNLPGVYKIHSDSYEGYVRDNQGNPHKFHPGATSDHFGVVWATGIFFSNN
ncbi:hypothetical protein ACFORO_39020 [Amycolatopsis halotolerans]|uniref:Uncharacterized protein n=1 Tax=Amycolatopsis halotolerans TaxID=330083 RepID=A0ABV7QSD0_9PSEU